MIIEKTVTLSRYMPTAHARWESPDIMGHAAGRMCAEALIEELLDYGYRKDAILDGMEAALTEAGSAPEPVHT